MSSMSATKRTWLTMRPLAPTRRNFRLPPGRGIVDAALGRLNLPRDHARALADMCRHPLVCMSPDLSPGVGSRPIGMAHPPQSPSGVDTQITYCYPPVTIH